MKLKKLGNNETQLHINKDLVVLFSYNIPVAFLQDGKYFKTNKKFSVTTSKHINKWIGEAPAQVVDQSKIEELVK